jgi:hypothetical protein
MNVIRRWLFQYTNTVDFSIYHWNAKSVTLARIIRYYTQRNILHHWNLEIATHSTKGKKDKE